MCLHDVMLILYQFELCIGLCCFLHVDCAFTLLKMKVKNSKIAMFYTYHVKLKYKTKTIQFTFDILG